VIAMPLAMTYVVLRYSDPIAMRWDRGRSPQDQLSICGEMVCETRCAEGRQHRIGSSEDYVLLSINELSLKLRNREISPSN